VFIVYHALVTFVLELCGFLTAWKSINSCAVGFCSCEVQFVHQNSILECKFSSLLPMVWHVIMFCRLSYC
jgi:hypothetical protein